MPTNRRLVSKEKQKAANDDQQDRIKELESELHGTQQDQGANEVL